MTFESDAESINQSTEERSVPVTPDGPDVAFSPGMRVRLDGAPINTTLTTSLGTIVAEGQWDTYIVRLDAPAVYRNDDGTEQRMDEVRVLHFNLTPLT